MSTRKVKAITEELCGHAFSASSISAINKRLDESLAAFAGHLRFQNLLHHRADHIAQTIRVRQQNLFDRRARSLTFNLGHGGVPSRESG